MQYTKLFKPPRLRVDFRVSQEKSGQATDRRDGKLYCYDDNIVLRVNIALATGRPLLVRGPSGCGKSSLAYNVARVMKRRYYEKVITGRDQARDLLWRFDAVRRLGDAQFWSAQRTTAGDSPASTPFDSYFPYIEPEVLWWVFDRRSALRRGLPSERTPTFAEAVDPVVFEPPAREQRRSNAEEPEDAPCVVLIDEIDKADPDVPNDLLVPLGSLEFTVAETERRIKFDRGRGERPDPRRLPLVVITSNDERRLPQAFLRRCVQLEIEDPTPERLLEIATASEGPRHKATYQRVLEAVEKLAGGPRFPSEGKQRVPCSIAEFLDAVRACLRLDRQQKDNVLKSIVEATTWKRASSMREAVT